MKLCSMIAMGMMTGAMAADVNDAAWIGEAVEAPAPRFLRFRCPFRGSTEPLKLALSADQRYVLMLDGKIVGRGPAFGDERHWWSQSLELHPGEGEHLLEAVVWKLDVDDHPSTQHSFRQALVLKADGVYDRQLSTGTAEWKVGVLHGTAPNGRITSSWTKVGSQFLVRGTSFVDEQPAEYSPVSVVRTAERARHSRGGTLGAGWKVFPSHLPEQLHRLVRPGETPAPFEVAANSRREIVFDLGNFYCAYPWLAVRGGKGAKLTWSWTEALRDPKIRDDYSWQNSSPVVHCSKGDRSKREGMVFDDRFAAIDTFIADGRDRATFTTPWWRCGRWCRLVVETGDEPLSLTGIALDETRYPFECESSFECDDETLKPIAAMCVRGVQMCGHEVMYDCPFWEQQMYPGDSRVALLAMTAMTGDDRLMKQCLEIFDCARRYDGSIPMNWPSDHDQYSATWTLSWALSVGDYSRWRGDEEWLRARLPGLEHTMLGFARYENAAGLLQDVPGWSYLDWTAPWRPEGFAPPGAPVGAGVSSVLNLLYLRAMQATADAWEAGGDPVRAGAWRARGRALGKTIAESFWDEASGRVADTLEKNRFSEHAQALAITTGCLGADRDRLALAALVKGAPDQAVAASFCLHYVFEAFSKLGRGELVLGKLDCWRQYVAMNMNCPLESLVFPRSDCHAFGAHPLFHFHSGIAGVTPAAPFFAKVRVAPSPGPLRHIRASTPHPRGCIRTELDFADGGVDGTVALPEGVTGVFVWRGRETALGSGSNRIRY